MTYKAGEMRSSAFTTNVHLCRHAHTPTHIHMTTHKDVCVRTVTFHALVYQPVEEGATVVTEGGAGVGVDLKLVFTTWILQRQKHREREFNIKVIQAVSVQFLRLWCLDSVKRLKTAGSGVLSCPVRLCLKSRFTQITRKHVLTYFQLYLTMQIVQVSFVQNLNLMPDVCEHPN